jgi:pimeloyl-ACP methyl ester carboxylesterase
VQREKAMSGKLIDFLFVLVVSLTGGCSTKVGMFVAATINPIKPSEIKLSDGYVATFYTLQKGSSETSDSILFFVGGSGHVSKRYYLRSYFEELPEKITIYALQKRFVGHGETGLFEPAESFHQYNDYPQLVQDQNEFIRFILTRQDHLSKRVIIFGVSEGGNIAVQLAAEIPQATHLIILGSGGMTGIDEFRLWGKNRNIDFNQIYQVVEKDPDSIEKKVLGQTYKYWASFLPVNPMDSLKRLEIPILAAIGSRDEMTPVESVSFLRSEFEKLGKENLTVKIFPDCDHVLNDSSGRNHRGEFFEFVSQWLRGT